MKKKNRKQTRFEFDLLSLANWSNLLEANQEEEYNEPERFKSNLYVLHRKIEELATSYQNVRKRTFNLVCEEMWKQIKYEINKLYGKKEE